MLLQRIAERWERIGLRSLSSPSKSITARRIVFQPLILRFAFFVNAVIIKKRNG